MSAPRLVGVGVGPGDPQLLTLAGLAELRAASRVYVPVLALAEKGRAETVVRAHLDGRTVERLSFALNHDIDGPQARRHRHWDAAAATVAAQLNEHGSTVAFATIGDPNIYSTFGYLAATVRELVSGLEVHTVPGITAMQAAASAAGITLVEGAEPLTLLPLTRDTAVLRERLAAGGTVVAYKGGRRIAELRELIDAVGATGRAVYAEHLGTPDERVSALAELEPAQSEEPGSEEGAGRPYLSTVVVLPKRDGRGEQL
ncbi:MAG: precorrin-2 C(20)-methyltransferase [Sciscionella sp.]